MQFKVSTREKCEHETFERDGEGRELTNVRRHTFVRVQLYAEPGVRGAQYIMLELSPIEAERFPIGALWELCPLPPKGARPAGEA